jgi:hypothetical protein
LKGVLVAILKSEAVQLDQVQVTFIVAFKRIPREPYTLRAVELKRITHAQILDPPPLTQIAFKELVNDFLALPSAADYTLAPDFGPGTRKRKRTSQLQAETTTKTAVPETGETIDLEETEDDAFQCEFKFGNNRRCGRAFGTQALLDAHSREHEKKPKRKVTAKLSGLTTTTGKKIKVESSMSFMIKICSHSLPR